MAHIIVAANPELNINGVNEVLETDPVLASFINVFFQQFLENDQALKNMIDKKPNKSSLAIVASTGSYHDLADRPNIASVQDIYAIVNGTYVDEDESEIQTSNIATEEDIEDIVKNSFQKG